MIRAYGRARRRVFAGTALTAAAVFGILALGNVSFLVSGYAALVAGFFGLMFLAADVIRFRSRHRQLTEAKRLLAEGVSLEEHLPDPDSLQEEDYQELVRELTAERSRAAERAGERLTEMVEYYTLWAHQIKTPIAAMELLLQSAEQPPAAELKEELQKIEQYVEMVMGYLRLNSGSTDYRIARYDLDEIVRPVVRKYASSFIRRRLRLQYEPLNSIVLTDEKWLSFVVEQVLSNALKYTRTGSISIRLEAPKTVCIADTGIGILPEDLPRIFEQGFTGYNGREDKKASGIGLYLCRQICLRLGHRISASSEPGKGTVIRIDLGERSLEVE